jgi:hypothetical protein
MPGLANKYYALRHGQSQANTAGIIVSNQALGVAVFKPALSRY